MAEEKVSSVSGPSVPKTERLPYSGKRPFYGWFIVLVGFVTQAAQGLVNLGFSTYPDLLQSEFGWSKAALAGPRSVTSVQNSVLGPITGWLVDRFGPRLVVATGIILTGGGLIIFSATHYVPREYALFMYYFSNIIMALGTSLEGLLVMSVAVNHWFRRGATMAQSMMLLGYSLAGVFGIPGLVLLQTRFGWYGASMWAGIGIIVIGLPFSMLLRTRPEAFGLLPDGDIPGQPPKTGRRFKFTDFNFTLKQAVRTRAFWCLAFGWATGTLCMGVVQIHLFLHLEQDAGLSRTTAALIYSIASISNIPARLIGGYIGDRMPKNLTLAVACGLMASGMFALAAAKSFHVAIIFALLYGVGWGISTPVMNAIQGEYFGMKSQGVIRGWIQLVSLPFTITAPVLVGWMADRLGNYYWALTGVGMLTVVGTILVILATRPKHPDEIASVS